MRLWGERVGRAPPFQQTLTPQFACLIQVFCTRGFQEVIFYLTQFKLPLSSFAFFRGKTLRRNKKSLCT